MPTNADQQLMQETFAEAIRRPQRPAETATIEHGPLANRKPDKSLFILGLNRIRPDPNQIRTQNKSATDQEVKELAESIRALGIENPLTVRYVASDDIYELIAGERRYAASKLIGLEEVPVKVINADDATVRRLQLHENVHRANLTPMELGQALESLLHDGETPESLATLLCKSPAYVQKALSLASHVTNEAKQFIADNPSQFKSMDVLYDVAQVKEEEQLPVLHAVVQQRLTRDQVRDMTAPLKQEAKTEQGRSRGRRAKERPIVRSWNVPNGAKVTVTFANPAATAEDFKQALAEAMERVE